MHGQYRLGAVRRGKPLRVLQLIGQAAQVHAGEGTCETKCKKDTGHEWTGRGRKDGRDEEAVSCPQVQNAQAQRLHGRGDGGVAPSGGRPKRHAAKQKAHQEPDEHARNHGAPSGEELELPLEDLVRPQACTG
eukprot:5392321-Prymnesium_polylepis.1